MLGDDKTHLLLMNDDLRLWLCNNNLGLSDNNLRLRLHIIGLLLNHHCGAGALSADIGDIIGVEH